MSFTRTEDFLDQSTKFQLNTILNRKRKTPIYHSDATSFEGRENGLDPPNENISALFAALSYSSDVPMDDPTSKLDSHANMIELGNFFQWNPYHLRVYREIPLQIVSSFGM